LQPLPNYFGLTSGLFAALIVNKVVQKHATDMLPLSDIKISQSGAAYHLSVPISSTQNWQRSRIPRHTSFSDVHRSLKHLWALSDASKSQADQPNCCLDESPANHQLHTAVKTRRSAVADKTPDAAAICNLLAEFCDFYILRANTFIFGTGKLEQLGYADTVSITNALGDKMISKQWAIPHSIN